MKKEYITPDVELVSLIAAEAITSGEDLGDGEMTDESSIFG